MSFDQFLNYKISSFFRIREKLIKPDDIKVMAIVVTYFETDLLEYVHKRSPAIVEDVIWLRSMTRKIVSTKFNKIMSK